MPLSNTLTANMREMEFQFGVWESKSAWISPCVFEAAPTLSAHLQDTHVPTASVAWAAHMKTRVCPHCFPAGKGFPSRTRCSSHRGYCRWSRDRKCRPLLCSSGISSTPWEERGHSDSHSQADTRKNRSAELPLLTSISVIRISEFQSSLLVTGKFKSNTVYIITQQLKWTAKLTIFCDFIDLPEGLWICFGNIYEVLSKPTGNSSLRSKSWGHLSLFHLQVFTLWEDKTHGKRARLPPAIGREVKWPGE